MCILPLQVWVMGEHPDDKSIETILAEEAREKAIAQAREEVQQLRKSVEKELTQLIEYKPLDDLEQVRLILISSFCRFFILCASLTIFCYLHIFNMKFLLNMGMEQLRH